MYADVVTYSCFLVLMVVIFLTLGPIPTLAFGVSSLIFTGIEAAADDEKDD